MKESVGSLRAYFIVVGLLSGYDNYQLLTVASGNIILLVLGLIGMALSIASLYIGISLPKLLVESPKLITTVLLCALGFLVVTSLLILSLGAITAALIRLVIGSLIIWYLFNSVRRLSAEERSKRG
jgi:CBS domain containing-hemolysin-like protein